MNTRMPRPAQSHEAGTIGLPSPRAGPYGGNVALNVTSDNSRKVSEAFGSRIARLAALVLAGICPIGGLARDTRPATTSAPAAVTQRIDLPGGGFYWLRMPPDYTRDDRAALVVCLHGTDDSAGGAIAFWSSCGTSCPAVWAAPQASGPGWSESDLPRLRETWADLRQRVGFDPDRVLLAGFSAGGAMAFHWLYREGLPASAVVTLANYMPPGVTADDITKQKKVPVFYGVGMEDINHERMRVGLALLRERNIRVTLVRPPIGHALSPDVGREALAWFEGVCSDAVRRQLDEAAAAMRRDRSTGSGPAAMEAERILSQARWQDRKNVDCARSLLGQALIWGRERLAQADKLAATSRQAAPNAAVDAISCYREIEREYAGTALAEEARNRRKNIEADPGVRQAMAEHDRHRREQEAMSLYLDVQRLMADGKFDEARRSCEMILSGYGDTPAADHARALLPKLPRSTKR